MLFHRLIITLGYFDPNVFLLIEFNVFMKQNQLPIYEQTNKHQKRVERESEFKFKPFFEPTRLVFTYSKLTIETQEQGVKYVQS